MPARRIPGRIHLLSAKKGEPVKTLPQFLTATSCTFIFSKGTMWLSLFFLRTGAGSRLPVQLLQQVFYAGFQDDLN